MFIKRNFSTYGINNSSFDDNLKITIEELKKLDIEIENILSSGCANKNNSSEIAFKYKTIVNKLNGDLNIPSLENISADHIEELKVTQENIFNFLKTLDKSYLLLKGNYLDEVNRFVSRNSVLFSDALGDIGKLEGKIKSMKLSSNEKIDFSFSRVGKFFILNDSLAMPDFNADLEFTKYVLFTYPELINNEIKKLISDIRNANEIDINKHPVDLFDSSYLNNMYFGHIIPEKVGNNKHITYNKELDWEDKIFKSKDIDEIETNTTITTKEMLDILHYCKEIIDYAITSNKKIKSNDVTIEELATVIKTVGKEYKNYSKEFVDCSIYPVKYEINRVLNIVDKVILSLENGIKNSPWKTRLVW